jgi:L-threonylcarbamoyladenylate synthase
MHRLDLTNLAGGGEKPATLLEFEAKQGTVPVLYDMRDSAAHADGIAAGVDALRAGLLVGMPTETVYGLAADATNPTAVGRIFLAKGRPRFNPLIVHVPGIGGVHTIADLDKEPALLARRFWPGPLTLVLPKASNSAIADLVTAGLDTVAVRVPAHPVAQALLEAFGRPIAAPSANRSGHVSATTAAHVAEDLGDAVSVILDAGPTLIGLESTIVGWWMDEAVLLRAGGVPRDEIEAVLGHAVLVAGEGKPVAPGMLASHYAPDAGLRLDVTDVRPGEALLTFGNARPANSVLAVATVNLSPKGDLAQAAAGFFAALRALDARAKAIAVVPIPNEGLGEAINDRLRRAAAPR